MSDVELLNDTPNDRLAALIFELASQLHEERVRRQALEAVLKGAGVDVSGIDALVDDTDFREQSRAAADASIRRLLAIIEESGGPEAPLRSEAPE